MIQTESYLDVADNSGARRVSKYLAVHTAVMLALVTSSKLPLRKQFLAARSKKAR
jgi:ribosomal protein L14